MPSPFDVLDIDPEASESEIKETYRARVKEAHPDQGGSIREFLAIKQAYERIQAGYDADDHAAAMEAEPESVEFEEEADVEGTRVEFLDYQAMTDHGWELTDDDLFEKAADAELAPGSYGHLLVDENDTLLEAAEEDGNVWPFACRGGACTNCAVAVVEGEMPMPASHILPPSMTDRDIRLSCLAAPTSEEAKIVYNVKHLPGLDDLRLPASRFIQAELDD
ncbi:ferredoxin Fer [Natronomonas sp. EA1]|uniref:ferredoxin Fer n=1 Tax=Natronomonas sp. EA1 TaxID=3421655 RepID=UPI003EBEBE67